MISAPKVHNALGLVVDLYGAMLADQAAEIARLTEQVAALTAALKQATLQGGHDLDGVKTSARMPSDARGGDGGEAIRAPSGSSAGGK